MNTLRTKAIVLSIVFTMCVLAMPLARVSADSFPSTFYVNNDTFYDAAAIFGAYTQLTADQKEIAAYLLGMYNLFYLGARGFQFQAGAYKNESEFIAKIKSFGYRLFTGSDGTALHSRFDANFCKYASAVLLYASQCNNVSFSTWFANLDDDFVIPVDQGLINSFTLMYNDNSNEGIASFGDIISPWASGTIKDFDLYGFEWYGDQLNKFTNFVNTYSPVIGGQVYNGNFQSFAGNSLYEFPNSLFILRGNMYTNFRWGHTFSANNYKIITNETFMYTYCVANPKLQCIDPTAYSYVNSIITTTANGDLSNFIYQVFSSYNPTGINDFNGFYPFISHVYLVDNLSNLSNCVEIYNNDSWNVVGLTDSMVSPIDTVKFKPKVITTIDLPDNTSNPASIKDMFNEDNVVDDDDNPVDPWQINVVVQPNDTNPISIDVNLFSSGKVYLEYLWEHTKKIAQFTKDILDCFEFDAGNGETYGPKYAIYGVLVLGMAGGMIAKFLL